VGGRAERTAVDLGQAESRVFGGDDDVGRADHADAATEAEAVNRRHDGHHGVVDRGEGVVAAAVDACDEARVARKLFDIHAGAKAAASGRQKNDVHAVVAARRRDDVGEFLPSGGVEGVDRRVIQHHLRDSVVDRRLCRHRAGPS